MSLYYREQKHICGKDYATAGYMEVDLYPVTPKQHKASRRAKKKEACTLAQQTYNDNRSKRYHVQLVNANFGKGDFSWTGTYDDDRSHCWPEHHQGYWRRASFCGPSQRA